jgi:outer membrane protein OmpA-like peptidoglycan-associated protein
MIALRHSRASPSRAQPRSHTPRPHAGNDRARAQARFGNAGASVIQARRSPSAGTVRRAPGPEPPISRGEEIRRSRTTPGKVSSGANPPTLTLSNFAIDVAQPKPEHKVAVARLIAELQKRGVNPAVVIVDGYADDTGSDERNIPLSRNRAFAIKDLLQPLGAPVLPFAHGESDAAGPNDTVEHRNQNRRVVISFMLYMKPKPPPPPPPEPFDFCKTFPWACGKEQPHSLCDEFPYLCNDHGICDDFPALCDHDVPLWPFLFLICVAEPELCASLSCLLDPWACLPCWPFCDEEPEKPEAKCDLNRLMRGLAKCELLEHLIDRLCGGGVMTASAPAQAPMTMPPMAPAIWLGAGGGLHGLMERDRLRQQQRLFTPAATRVQNPAAAAACKILRSRKGECRKRANERSGCQDDRGPCNEPLPIEWPKQLPRPRDPDLLRRGGDDSSGYDRNQTGEQQRLQKEIKSNYDRNPKLPPPDPCFKNDAEPFLSYQAHHVQPLFLDGSDFAENLCALERDRHMSGHRRLNDQQHMVDTDATWHNCRVTEPLLTRHPADQQYYIIRGK